MTFRQIIGVLWLRKWLIVAVVVVSLIAGGAVALVQPRVYESTTLLRTSAQVAEAGESGQLGGVQVDFGPNTLGSQDILTQAAILAGEPGADLGADVSVQVASDGATNSALVTAHAPTPEQSQARAAAVVDAYRAYLDDAFEKTLEILAERQQAALDTATAFQAQVNSDSRDLIALANLQNALGSLAEINDAIAAINNDGAPIIVLSPAGAGYLIGTSLLIVLLIALACGVIAGIGVALIRDQFDDRLRGESELERYAGAPSLGELPEERVLAKSPDKLPAAAREQSAIGEGLRSLRTALQVLLPSGHGSVTVTSVEPGDGKSFVAANLALTWAKSGKQTILVGGDLRRPSLAAYFGEAAEGPGLTELLLNAALDPNPRRNRTSVRADVLGALQETDFPGLRLLPTGERSADAADLLATPALAETIGALRDIADVVVIDAPPALVLADASLLAEHTDGAVVLASVGRTPRTLLTEAVEELRQNGVTVLGAVANRSRRPRPKSYAPYYVAADRTS